MNNVIHAEDRFLMRRVKFDLPSSGTRINLRHIEMQCLKMTREQVLASLAKTHNLDPDPKDVA